RHFPQDGALLGGEGVAHDLPRVHHRANTSVRRVSPDCVKTTVSQSSRPYVLTWCSSVVDSFARFRHDLWTFSSWAPKTTSVFVPWRPIAPSMPAIVFDF